LSTTCISTAWALQGLWAAPWLADVRGIERPAVVRHLFVMACSLSAGALLTGLCADRLRKRGIQPETALFLIACVLLTAETTLLLRLQINSYLPWVVIGAVGAATVLSYTILADYFPTELAGRANAALNIFHIGGAFVLQETMGLIIGRWANMAGHYPPTAYKTALAVAAGLQLIAMIWFQCSQPGRRDSALRRAKACQSTRNATTPASIFAIAPDTRHRRWRLHWIDGVRRTRGKGQT
jgi:MFS family permease